jgi:hypothetical protein
MELNIIGGNFVTGFAMPCQWRLLPLAAAPATSPVVFLPDIASRGEM